MEELPGQRRCATYRLPEPFFVVATQNPHEQLGTFALPESQLDRVPHARDARLSRRRAPNASC